MHINDESDTHRLLLHPLPTIADVCALNRSPTDDCTLENPRPIIVTICDPDPATLLVENAIPSENNEFTPLIAAANVTPRPLASVNTTLRDPIDVKLARACFNVADDTDTHTVLSAAEVPNRLATVRPANPDVDVVMIVMLMAPVAGEFAVEFALAIAVRRITESSVTAIVPVICPIAPFVPNVTPIIILFQSPPLLNIGTRMLVAESEIHTVA